MAQDIHASMEPRCNHLGNLVRVGHHVRARRPQWSPGVITWETSAPSAEAEEDDDASMEPRCNHLGNAIGAAGYHPPERRPQWRGSWLRRCSYGAPQDTTHQRGGLNGAQV